MALQRLPVRASADDQEPAGPRLIRRERSRRARKAVSARIHDAITRIGRANPALGRHLEEAVTTGTNCSYAPAEPTRWRL